jgi:simple sugar transport system ATP-binding protein
VSSEVAAEETTTNGPPTIVELAGVWKYYGATAAVRDVSLSVAGHEVVGLVGDNGSGKSTIVKIITGYHAPTKGTIRLFGRETRLTSPAAARALGVEAVYQDLALIDELGLWRNFFLGREISYGLGGLRYLNSRKMSDICARELEKLGLVHIRSIDEPAASLSGGEKQSLAITRAVYFGARLLLLDEPTAALSVRETRNVLDLIDQARNRGLGVIYIDHNIDHVAPVADRIVLLEHGRVAATFKRGEATVEELRELIARRRTGPGSRGPK